MKDPYVYEGTNVLKNKLDIKDEATLEKAESDFVGLAANRLRHSDFVIENIQDGLKKFINFCFLTYMIGQGCHELLIFLKVNHY